jgi:epoxyqueuosine reductase QueG
MQNLTVSRLRKMAEDYVAAGPERLKSQGWWRKPLLATARVDARFDRLIPFWSHKHLAYLPGMGRFGTHNLLITPAVCVGRLGSLVTDADIGDHPLTMSARAWLKNSKLICQ